MGNDTKFQENENKHLMDLIERIQSDFNDKVKNEDNASNVLLKGHLLIENILEECLSVYNIKTNFISRLSFYEKTKILSEIINKNDFLKERMKNIVPMLFSLNNVRNNLAHDLGFNISEADINNIGLKLGSEYIVKKYEVGHKKTRENLLFLLDKMVHELGLIIFLKIDEIKELNLEGDQKILELKK